MEDAVDQMWYALIGTNGDGMVAKMKQIDDKIDAYIANRPNTCYYRADMSQKSQKSDRLWDRGKVVVGEVIKLGAAFGVFAAIKTAMGI
jgi:hypothetical protein